MSLDPRRAAVAFAGSCAFVNLYATQSMLPVLAGEFGVSVTEVGLTITVALVAVALVAPFIGAVADGIGRKRIIVTSAIALTIPTLLAAFAQTLPELLFCRFLQGLLMPPIFVVTVAYIGEEFEPAEATAVTGVYVIGTVCGGFSGRFLSGIATDLWSWRAAFIVLAMVNLLSAIGIARWLPLERKFRPMHGLGAALRAFGDHCRNAQLLGTAAVGFTVLFTQVATFTYANFYLSAPPFNLGPTGLGMVFIVYLFGIGITAPATRLANRIGRIRTLALAVAMSSSGMLVTLAPSLPAVVAGLGLLAAGIFISQALATSYIGVAARYGKSTAVGVYVTCYYIGGSVGAVAPSPLWQRVGWPGCVALVILAELVMLTIATWCWRDRPLPAIADPALDGVPKTG
ncbi:MAG TPA: MFS transporter [Stellaceae bacterium]|nr:MFS transporter [Stellaceae bacterium]